MFLPAHHAETHIPTLRQFIKDNQLGILISAVNTSYDQIQCTHIPWLLDVTDPTSETELGVLRGHMAKMNPHAKALMEISHAKQGTNYVLEQEVSVVFNGPVQHYVTPHYYVETKPDTGKVVPTWNYATVQAYGKAKIMFDNTNDETVEFLMQQIDDLSRGAEQGIMKYEKGWRVSDAPPNYINMLRKNIIGIEIEITKLQGKWKMSQEMKKGDRQGVADNFGKLNTALGDEMSAIINERGRIRDSVVAARG